MPLANETQTELSLVECSSIREGLKLLDSDGLGVIYGEQLKQHGWMIGHLYVGPRLYAECCDTTDADEPSESYVNTVQLLYRLFPNVDRGFIARHFSPELCRESILRLNVSFADAAVADELLLGHLAACNYVFGDYRLLPQEFRSVDSPSLTFASIIKVCFPCIPTSIIECLTRTDIGITHYNYLWNTFVSIMQSDQFPMDTDALHVANVDNDNDVYCMGVACNRRFLNSLGTNADGDVTFRDVVRSLHPLVPEWLIEIRLQQFREEWGNPTAPLRYESVSTQPNQFEDRNVGNTSTVSLDRSVCLSHDSSTLSSSSRKSAPLPPAIDYTLIHTLGARLHHLKFKGDHVDYTNPQSQCDDELRAMLESADPYQTGTVHINSVLSSLLTKKVPNFVQRHTVRWLSVADTLYWYAAFQRLQHRGVLTIHDLDMNEWKLNGVQLSKVEALRTGATEFNFRDVLHMVFPLLTQRDRERYSNTAIIRQTEMNELLGVFRALSGGQPQLRDLPQCNVVSGSRDPDILLPKLKSVDLGHGLRLEGSFHMQLLDVRARSKGRFELNFFDFVRLYFPLMKRYEFENSCHAAMMNTDLAESMEADESLQRWQIECSEHASVVVLQQTRFALLTARLKKKPDEVKVDESVEPAIAPSVPMTRIADVVAEEERERTDHRAREDTQRRWQYEMEWNLRRRVLQEASARDTRRKLFDLQHDQQEQRAQWKMNELLSRETLWVQSLEVGSRLQITQNEQLERANIVDHGPKSTAKKITMMIDSEMTARLNLMRLEIFDKTLIIQLVGRFAVHKTSRVRWDKNRNSNAHQAFDDYLERSNAPVVDSFTNRLMSIMDMTNAKYAKVELANSLRRRATAQRV